GLRIAFLSDRDGRTQLHLIRVNGGEAVPLTQHETAVGHFEWAPDGKSIAFTAAEPESKDSKERKEKYGSFEVFEEDHVRRHLGRVPAPAELPAKPINADRLTSGERFTVGGFSWAPDGKHLAFDAARDPLPSSRPTSDIYVFSFADNSVKKIVETPGSDYSP